MKILRVNPEVRERVVSRLKKLREERDDSKVRDALDRLRKVADEGEENLFPYILEAVKAKATLGEISGVLREVWGEWRAPEIY